MKDVIVLVRLQKEHRDKLKEYVKTLPVNNEMSPYIRNLIINDLREKGIIK